MEAKSRRLRPNLVEARQCEAEVSRTELSGIVLSLSGSMRHLEPVIVLNLELTIFRLERSFIETVYWIEVMSEWVVTGLMLVITAIK